MPERIGLLMKSRIADVLYGITALVSLALGSIYILRSSFLPYHADALQQQWADLDGSLQVLMLALMDVAGAGWLALGVVVLVLVYSSQRSRQRSIRLLIPTAILIFYIPTLMATLHVTNLTPATAPWYGNLIAISAAVVGFVFDTPWKIVRQSKP